MTSWDLENRPSLGQLLDDAAAFLRERGVEGSRTDARLLAQHELGLDRAGLLTRLDRPPPAGFAVALDRLLARRSQGEPVSRIVGRREFWSLDLLISRETLDPRPETEILVDAALAACPDRNRSLSVLDLGTGSGCLLLALLTELPRARGLGTDRSEAAVRTALLNADRHGLSHRVRFLVADWADSGIRDRFDLVVANPPYIPTPDIEHLPAEVRMHDPWIALAGGADGLTAYRHLADSLGSLLHDNGVACLEIGVNQAMAVRPLMETKGLIIMDIWRDLAGLERCLVVQKKFG